MTRPEVERIAEVFDRPGQPEYVEVITDLCHYALAMEAALNAVLPSTVAMGINTRIVALRRKFDAAVARWTP